MRNFLIVFFLSAFMYASVPHAAIVDGTVISLDEFNTIAENARKNLAEEYNIDLNSEEGKFILATTQQSIIDDMINQLIINQQAVKMKIYVTDEDIEQELERLRQGFPSQKMFEETLAQENINPRELSEGIRSRLVAEKIKKSLANKIAVTDKELENFIESNRELFVDTADTSEARKYLLRKKENEIFDSWFTKIRNAAKIEINPDIIQDEYELPFDDTPTITDGRA